MAPLRAPVGSASARPGRNAVAEDLPDGRAEALGPLEPAAQGDGAKHAQNVGCRDFLDRRAPISGWARLNSHSVLKIVWSALSSLRFFATSSAAIASTYSRMQWPVPPSLAS